MNWRHLCVCGVCQLATAAGLQEANREIARQTYTWQAGWEVWSRDPQLRLAARWANRRFVAPALAQSEEGASPAGPPQPVLIAPVPFQLRAPAGDKPADSDRLRAAELRSRYDAVAARSATAWQSAEALRLRLRARGMELNIQTSAAQAHIQLYLEMASEALQTGAWDQAMVNIERAEYETGKVMNVTGR